MAMTIGQLAARAGVNVQTVRYYERRELMPEPARTSSGYRHLEISGMTCGSCATTARIALEQSAGVFAARVSYDAARATVYYDPALTSPDAIGARLTERTGYRATVVPAMTR